MKHIIIAALAAILLASCSHVKRTTAANQGETKTTVDSSGKRTVEIATTNTTTVTIDTTVTTKGDSLEAVIDPADTTDQSVESGTIKVEVRKDPRTGKLRFKAKAKPQTIDMKATRTDAKAATAKVTDEQEKQVDTKAKTKAQTTTKEVDRWVFPWWIWVAAGLAALFALARWKLKLF